MKRLIVLLLATFSAFGTGNLIIKNYDFSGGPLIAVVEGLPDSQQCFLILPHARADEYHPQSIGFHDAIDSFYQRPNGWVRLYRQDQFHHDSRKALRLCNRERIYLKHKPIYEKYVQIPSPYYTPDITITWPDDAKKDIS